MATKKQLEQIEKWRAEKVDRMEIKPRKELQIPHRIDAAIADGKANSRQEYILTAICEKLERDGFSLEE